MTLYIGIDPGKTGGIAAVDEHGQLVEASKFPETEHDILALVDRMCRTRDHEFHPRFALIEKVNAMPGKAAKADRGRVSIGATSAFTFGRGYGFLRGCLAALQVPFEECPPQRWQKALNCLTGGDKNVSKAKAQQLFPQHTWTHATADAVLIAEYNRRVRTGQLAHAKSD